MELVVRPSVESVASHAADIVCRLLRRQPAAHLCLAAGSSPRPLYAELQRRVEAGQLALSAARLSKLDEWLGLPLEHPATCESDLREHFLEPLGIRADQCLSFDGLAADPLAECRRVMAELALRGPFDLCVLGLGLNGHLGMNEPADALEPQVHMAELAEVSRHHSLLSKLPEPPTHGLTMGMAELMLARKVVLVVTGESKQAALQRLVTGPVSTRFPASLLRLHPRCWCLADEAAAAGLTGAAV